APGNVPVIKLENVAEQVSTKLARRANYHIQLLKLGGAKTSELQEAFQKGKDKNTPGDWNLLAQKSREKWNLELPKTFYGAKNDYPTTERLGYLLYPFDKSGNRSKSEIDWAQNPPVGQNRSQHQAFWHWLGKRFQADHQVVIKATPELSFYAEAA